jgi:hypothetical protein
MGKNKLSQSKNIHDQLNDISIKINNQNGQIEEHSRGIRFPDGYFNKLDELKKTISILQIKFQELFIRLYNKCISDIYYWQYCPFKVYKETFKERLKQYTNFDFVDSNEIDFYNSELESISKSKNRYLYYFKLDINNAATLDLDFFSSENMRKIDYSQTKKIEFLKSKLKTWEISLGANLKLNTDCSETELHKQITDTFRQKYKSLKEYIVSVDDDGKIVFLKYEDFCNKLNKLKPVKRYVNVVVNWLRFLLEQELITPSQIPDVLKIIKNETLITHEEIRDFIHDVDEVGKIVLLPIKEMWKKIHQLGDRYVLIYAEFDNLIIDNILSEKYIRDHWKNVEQFKRFIDRRNDFLSKQEDNKWENDIVKYARSNAPIQKKIKYLTELLTDIIRVNPDDDLALKPKINLLESLIKEVKDKQRFETIKLSEPSGKKNDTDKNDTTKPENPHERYFVNGYHWQLFDEWRMKHIRKGKELADYSFIYRVMHDDGFIYDDIKPTGFKEWIEGEYTLNLGKQLKPLHNAAPHKYDLYASLIDKYKLHSATLQKHSKNTTIT